MRTKRADSMTYHPKKYELANAAHRFLLGRQDGAIVHSLLQAGFLPLSDKRILDVGCGAGWHLRRLVDLGAASANCFGIDITADRLAAARYRNAHMTFLEGSAESVPFADDSFDLVTQFVVFSSMPPEVRRATAREMRRVLRPGGAVLWYDMRYPSPRNANVSRMGRAEIRALFPDCTCRLKGHTLLPPLARLVAPRSEMACLMLEKVPVLRSHYLGMISPH